jgi:uncharacterized protein (TIGR03435 family)
MQYRVAGFLAMAFAGTAHAQLTFEVASVKPAAPRSAQNGLPVGIRGGPGTADPSQMTCGFALMNELLIRAFGVKKLQVSGPAWLDTERYDIIAKVPPGTTPEQANLMLRNLLAERFGLAFHRETKDLLVYELTLGKGVPKLKESAPDSTDRPGIALAPGPDRGLMASAKQQPLSAVFPILEARWGRPILDKTGLTGKYDFSVGVDAPHTIPAAGGGTPDNPANSASEPAGNTLAAMVERDLGLKLEEKKAPVEMLVIDRVDKVPTGN